MLRTRRRKAKETATQSGLGEYPSFYQAYVSGSWDISRQGTEDGQEAGIIIRDALTRSLPANCPRNVQAESAHTGR